MSKAWSKDIIVESHTFGGTRACEVLADMMNQNIVPVFEKHRTLSFLNKASNMFAGAKGIANKRIRTSVIELINKDLTDKINMMPYPPKFISYLKNVISHYYRKSLERVT